MKYKNEILERVGEFLDEGFQEIEISIEKDGYIIVPVNLKKKHLNHRKGNNKDE